MDHDRLFKELLSHFFAEFVDLFLPDLSTYLDRETVMVALDKEVFTDVTLDKEVFTDVTLDKEVFTDVTLGEKHEVDLLMKARVRGEDAFFLIHLENQSTAQADFPKRMFRYFARLTEKYDLPVYPVVIFSYDTPQRPEPTRYQVAFPGRTVLRFEYAVIQLNRLPWRRFVHQDNPVAGALMAKMKMSVKDRPKVKLECLRLLARLKLDPARSRLIGGFIDSYLRLSAAEMRQYEREFAQLAPAERESTMTLVSSWELEGMEKGLEQGLHQGLEQGLHQGKEALIVRLLRRRFGEVSTETESRLAQLSTDELDDLGEALLDFADLADLEQWLAGKA